MAPKSVPVPMITRVRLKNFRSIAECDVELGPLTILVGPNGSGKSNFIKALDFIADALNNGLESAIGRQGGMNSLLSRWALDDPDSALTAELEMNLPQARHGTYSLSLRRTANGGVRLAEERCNVVVSRSPLKTESFVVSEHRGEWTNTRGYIADPRRGLTSRALTLPHHADHVYFGSVYRALVGMSFYSLHVAEMRQPRVSNNGERLTSDGANVSSVLARMEAKNLHGWSPSERVADFLSAVTGRVSAVRVNHVGRYLALEFEETLEAHERSLDQFDASEVSYGTLRTLGVLVALYQGSMADGSPVTLVGIEEPETAVHPGAATAIYEAMDEASLTTQVIATSHSAAMLDRDDLDLGVLRAVAIDRGRTRIGPVDAASQRILEERLFTAGELLAMEHLAPDDSAGNGTPEEVTATPL